VLPSSRMAWAQPNHTCQGARPRNPAPSAKPNGLLDACGCLRQAMREEGGAPLFLLEVCPPARRACQARDTQSDAESERTEGSPTDD
jgi:hypothetical protein